MFKGVSIKKVRNKEKKHGKTEKKRKEGFTGERRKKIAKYKQEKLSNKKEYFDVESARENILFLFKKTKEIV